MPAGKKSAEEPPARGAGKKSPTTGRRARGEGTVYHDDTRDRWVGAVTIGGRRRKVVAHTKTDARARLAGLLAAKTTGAPVDNRSRTVAQAVDSFLERGVPERTSNGRPLTPTTVATYRWAADIIVDRLGATRLADLTVHDVEAMLDELAKRRKMSAASLRKIRGTLQRVIAFAERRGDISRNVAKNATITPKAAPAQPRTALHPVAARKLLAALRDERNGVMFALSLRVGLRPGEAAGLYWDDLDGDVLNVRRGVRVVGGRAQVVDDLKTEASRRAIELPADIVDWLDVHRRAQVVERLAASSWHDARLIFASPNGRVLSPPNVRRQLVAVCDAAGVPVVRPNELRHSCASLLSDLGVPNELIADLLGHTTTRMVDQTYRHRLRPVVDIAARADWLAEPTTSINS
jgi:integrase